MRKLLCCVLMTMLPLLTACGTGQGRENQAETLALTIRGEYLEMTDCTAVAEVTADYGQRVYQYTIDVDWGEEETTLTLTAPETVAGMSARLQGKDSFLEYEELSLETGPMDDRGLTPVSAVPALLEAARSGYIRTCALEEERLRVDCGEPEGEPGQGREITLWFHRDTHVLEGGEVRLDGVRAILCQFREFEMGNPPTKD